MLFIVLRIRDKTVKNLMIWMFCVLNFIFGVYLWVKNGLTIDYGTQQECTETYAFLFLLIGFIMMFITFIYPILWLFWRVKNDKRT